MYVKTLENKLQIIKKILENRLFYKRFHVIMSQASETRLFHCL